MIRSRTTGWTAFPVVPSAMRLRGGAAARGRARCRHRHRPSRVRCLPPRAPGDPHPARPCPAPGLGRSAGSACAAPPCATRSSRRTVSIALIENDGLAESGRASSGCSARRCSRPRKATPCSPGSPPPRPGSLRSPSPRRATATTRRRGDLDLDHPDIQADLAGGTRHARPSAGLCAGSRSGGPRGAGGLTVLCCDNMASNGRTLRRPRPPVRRARRPRARDLDRGPGPLPEQHGRPHRPGRDAGLARPCGRAAGPARRGGGQQPKPSRSG